MLSYTVTNSKYSNIKEIAKDYFQISDRFLAKLKKNNRVILNGNSEYINRKVSLGDTISFDIDFDEESENIVPIESKLEIIFEDSYLLIVNKPSGIPVHPSMSHYEDSLSNRVKYYFNSTNLKRKIRPVNRLDKDTSGIVIFAKNEYVQEILIKEMKSNVFTKEYMAILTGNLDSTSGKISAPISRKEGSIIEREVNINGSESITYYEVVKNFKVQIKYSDLFEELCVVKFKLETGRTHQIRVHSKHIGHPILGDTLYGNGSKLISRQALHAYKISFIHPIKKDFMSFEIDLPTDIKQVLY